MTKRKEDVRELWERQPGESGQAFEAFKVYRDLGLTRSIQVVARRLGKSASLMTRWSSRWQWSYRADSWDREQDRQFLLVMQEERKRAAREQLKMAQALRSRAAAALLEKGPGELSAGDIARFVEAAAKSEARVLGFEQQSVTVQVDAGGSLELLTPEERRMRMLEIQRRLKVLTDDADG